jgi:serine phosphatase RsbU (regulator of sigma subunit)
MATLLAMLAEAPDRRRVVITSAAGIGVEATVVAVISATGSIHHLAGVPSSIGITAAIVCGLFGGRVSGGVVGVVNAAVFLTLAASSGNNVALGGVPTVVLWFAIGFGTGASADYLRERLDRAFSELRRANESAEFVASSLQQSLLPERLPEIPGVEIGTWFRPAGDGRIVGGDFFDVWRVNPERFGDVCGKGPTAAAVTALARHTIRTASMLDQSPADTLRVVNDAVRRRTGSGQFCTALAVMGEPHPEGFEITVACGGHSPPIVVRATGAHETVGRPGTLLGIWDEIDVDECRAVLRPGDSLVLWTDGITDRRGVAERFGQQRLEQLIDEHARDRAGQLATTLGRAAQDFADEVPQDDAAVLILGVHNGDHAA